MTETRMVLGIDPAGGPESAVLMTHDTGWRTPILVGGRGHGKVAAQLEVTRVWMDEFADFMAELRRDPHEEVRAVVYKHWVTPKKQTTPAVSSVRWICKAPTEPVYPKGTYGWMMEQYQARITPEMREHNRRIAEENAAIMDHYADLLGVKPHGTDS